MVYDYNVQSTNKTAPNRAVFVLGVVWLVMTLCAHCLEVFESDRNYIVRPTKSLYVDKHDCECFICCHRGRDYDIIKIDKTKH